MAFPKKISIDAKVYKGGECEGAYSGCIDPNDCIGEPTVASLIYHLLHSRQTHPNTDARRIEVDLNYFRYNPKSTLPVSIWRNVEGEWKSLDPKEVVGHTHDSLEVKVMYNTQSF